MRKQRGLTLAELIIASALIILTLIGVLALMISGLRSFERTTSDINLTQPNAQAMRRISETLRQALSITISSDGSQINYVLPKVSASPDPYTGEKELVYPLTPDGIQRSFQVKNRNLVSLPDNRKLLSGINPIDPHSSSTQYQQSYRPFQRTTIGAKNAISINLITSETVNGKIRFTRMKSTVLVQNI